MVFAKVYVSEQYARVIKRDIIPVGLIGGKVEFEFDEHIWGGLTKTVVFRGAETKDVLLDGNTAIIPKEVVSRTRVRLNVGVYGTNSDDTIAIPTLWADLGEVRDAADPSGDPAADPALPIWAQLEGRVANLERSGSNGTLEVTIKKDLNKTTTTATSQEIFEAYKAGKVVTCRYIDFVDDFNCILQLVMAADHISVFSGIFNSILFAAGVLDDNAVGSSKEIAAKEDIPEFVRSCLEENLDQQVADAVEDYLTQNPPTGGVAFETDPTLKLENGVLSVNTTDQVQEDNTLPITSQAVYEQFETIVALLKTI